MPTFGELLGEEICEERESRGWTQVDLALKAFDDEDSVRRLHNYEKGKVANPQARTYMPICDALNITRDRIRALKAQASNAKSLNEDELGSLRAQKGSLQSALDEARRLTRNQLTALAEIFAHADPDAATDATLVEFLTLKAEDYRALQAEVDGIEDGLKRLSNLKSAAQDAIAQGDLDEVETLLSRVQEVELEEAAKTAQLRATNALLRDRPEQAYRILSAAADSFAAIDDLAPIRHRLDWEDLLYAHALRFGGEGLHFAAQMNREALRRFEQEAEPALWARTQNNLAISLQEHGKRSGGAEGAELLAQAVAAYNAALQVRTRDAHPVHWATTQNNLGGALQIQGQITGGAEGAELLAQAVAAFNAALQVHTRDAHPVDWAMTQNNLAIALQAQGQITGGAEGAELLAQAVAAYTAALQVLTRDAHPVDWATTQNNLAAALEAQGQITGGAEGAELLAQAVAAYTEALQVRTRDAHPVDWAMTQANLAGAYLAKAEHETCADPRADLQLALTHVRLALEVFDPQHMPYDFDKASALKTGIEAALAALP